MRLKKVLKATNASSQSKQYRHWCKNQRKIPVQDLPCVVSWDILTSHAAFWRARRARQNTRDEQKYPTTLHTRPSNNRFIIQLEKYKIELGKCARTAPLPTYDENEWQTDESRVFARFHQRCCWLVWQKWNLVKLVYSVNRFFHKFSSALLNICLKSRDGVTNNQSWGLWW